jgi:S-(hydroxymethyl)glutathione dehydrogenase/alcohol dehydrogenase
MKTEAAILWGVHEPWSVEEIELDPPKKGEVLVKLHASGMCHSDEHLVTGDLPFALPMIGGHEGAGIVEEVGEGVTMVAPGDHVVFGFIPACGKCAACASGHENLCEVGGMAMATGRQITDGTARHHAKGQDLGLMCLIGTFAKYTVANEASCIKIPDDLPLDKACLVGCGVTTGWGSAVYAGKVKPGDSVAVIGIGGVGINAVQGAKQAGAERIFAIDPVEFKRESAQKFGATHTAPSVDEAFGLIQQETWGRMCDTVIVTMGVGSGAMMASIMTLVAKMGKAVVTNIHPALEMDVTMSLLDLTLMEKQVVGSLFGSANPRYDVPRLLEYYRSGSLDLDNLVTKTYSLDQVNEGYEDMRNGKNIRGVLVYE